MTVLFYIAAYDSPKQTFDYVASLPVLHHYCGQKDKTCREEQCFR